jgi:hypothetical protein
MQLQSTHSIASGCFVLPSENSDWIGPFAAKSEPLLRQYILSTCHPPSARKVKLVKGQIIRVNVGSTVVKSVKI